jgi:hypothetical protein
MGFGTTTNGNIQFFANNTNWASISNLGGFGLGNTSAYNNSTGIAQGVALIQNKLSVGTTGTTDINGATTIQAVGTRATDILSLSDGTTKFAAFIDNTSATPALIGTISNHSFGVFTNNGGAQQKWFTNGNTTIGSATDNSNGKLQVTGNVAL